MINIDNAKKIIRNIRKSLLAELKNENISKATFIECKNFLNESSDYSVLHYAARGFFPVGKPEATNVLLTETKHYLKDNRNNDLHLLATCCRESAVYNITNKRKRDFLLKECSDFEITSLVLNGKFPKEYSIRSISNLMENASMMIGQLYGTRSFIYESFVSSRNNFLNEIDWGGAWQGVKHGAGEVAGGVKKDFTGTVNPETGKHENWIDTAVGGVHAGVNKITGHVDPQVIHKAQPISADQISKAIAQAKQSGVAAGQSTEIHDAVHAKGKEMLQHAGVELSGLKHKIASGLASGSQALSTMAATHPLGAAIGAAAAAALAIFGAKKLYDMKKANQAKACQTLSGTQRTNCIVQAGKAAIQAEISDLQTSLSSCKVSKDPQACVARIQNKVRQLRASM